MPFIPHIAYCGSLNYTMNAFYKRREAVGMCSSIEAYKYYQELLPDAIDCFDPLVSEKLKNVINNSKEEAEEPDNSEKDYLKYDKLQPVDTLVVSLLRADGSDMVPVLTGVFARTAPREIRIRHIFRTMSKIERWGSFPTESIQTMRTVRCSE